MQPQIRRYQENRFDAKKADKDIMICIKCKCGWERNFNKNGFNYYKSFVSYGKKKGICPMCKGKESLCLSLI